eukprot:TRINITY_DN42015_c0_g1_i1.p1 TRINITY_DN42015_c0_g1~~TRINITY_DN42015_c0_g1_i1.p1  ORF type:complete len:469 (-),score=106.78 TRINITY_DN42015_c0_g1_i1:3-1409(-)
MELEQLRKLVGQAAVEKLAHLAKAALDGTGGTITIETKTVAGCEERAARADVHSGIRSLFGMVLQSETLKTDQGGVIRVKAAGGDNRRATPGQAQGRYLHFDLTKRNLSTADAIDILAKCLKRGQKHLTYLGKKDKQAVTTQRICAHRVTKDELLRGLAKTGKYLEAKHPAAKDGAAHGTLLISDASISYSSKRLWLGQLTGNHFAVTLRRLPHSLQQVDVDAAFERLLQSGFPNYFGPQRFGRAPYYNHHIGAALLTGDWQKAVEMILERPATQLEAYRTGGRSPAKSSLERRLRQMLAEGHTDYRVALDSLPRPTLHLYLDAAASWIYNRVLSRCVAEGLAEMETVSLVLPGSSDWRRHCPEELQGAYASEVRALFGGNTEDPWQGDAARSLLASRWKGQQAQTAMNAAGAGPQPVWRPALVHPKALRWNALCSDDSAKASEGMQSLRFECELPASAYLTSLLHEL